MMRKDFVTFSEKNLTGNAGLVLLARFAERFCPTKMIDKALAVQRSANADYQVADAILMLMVGELTGVKHIIHTIIFRNDGIMRALFRRDKFPDATTLQIKYLVHFPFRHERIHL